MGDTDVHFLQHCYGPIYITRFQLDGHRMSYNCFSSGSPGSVCKSKFSPFWALLILNYFSYYFTALTN